MKQKLHSPHCATLNLCLHGNRIRGAATTGGNGVFPERPSLPIRTLPLHFRYTAENFDSMSKPASSLSILNLDEVVPCFSSG